MVELVAVQSLEGPNVFYPQPAVALAVRADVDLRDRLAALIKQWAQAVGLIVGYVRGDTFPLSGGAVLTQLSFTCSLPPVGAAMAQAVVADLQAEQRGDADYSHDDELFRLLRRRKREEPSLAVLQLQAEARARGLPLFKRQDGLMQLGLGAKGWRFDPAGATLGMPIDPPWDSIGVVPLVAVSGFAATALADELAHALQQQGRFVALASSTFDVARAAMGDTRAEVIVVTVEPTAVLERGLPFDRCNVAVIGALSPLSENEQLAAGLPALVVASGGRAVIDAGDSVAAGLAARAGQAALLVAATDDRSEARKPHSGDAAPQQADVGRSPLVRAALELI